MPHHNHHHRDGGASPQSPPPKPNPKFLSLLLKVIIMTFITSSFFLLLGLASLFLLPILLVSHYHHHHRHRHGGVQTHHRNPNSSNGLSSKQIKKLPIYRYVEEKNRASDDCAVCLDGYKSSQGCRKLEACGHVFHRRCVDTWLLKVAACPICRAPIRVNLEESLDRGEVWFFGTRSNQFRVW